MNLVNSLEEETKTIKYLNKNGSQPDEKSQSATEKQFEQELLLARKIFHPTKSHPKNHADSHPNNCKIVVIETLENYGHQKIQPNLQGPINKSKHKKGKSMDLEQLFTSSREDRKGHSKPEGSKQKSKRQNSKQYEMDLKERKSISEMKNYQHISKKLPVHKNSNEGQHNFKKKKSKTVKSGEIKSLKKQMKRYIEDTPIYIHRKSKSGKQTQRNHNNPLPKNLKSYSQSEQIFCEKPKKRNSQREKSEEEFRDITYSMPMTSKIIHLLSNSSSVYNSQKELETFNIKKTYVIPTQESVPQIQEIRTFEHTLLRKSSSERFKHTRRPTPITNLVQEESEERFESTENIIKNIILKLQEAQHTAHINELNKDIEQISYIPYENSIKERNLDSIGGLLAPSANANTFQDISQCQSIKMDSQEGNQSEEVRQKQQQIKKLDNIISQLSKNGEKCEKDSILNKIKGLIGSPSPLKKEEKIEQHSNQDESNLDLTNSQLKSSSAFEPDMSQLNLEMLDQALRERQAYLKERKDRELEKLEQIYEESDLSQQKEKIIKWIEHQIKSVVHTRHQLWKGFNIAKELLEGKEEQAVKKKKNQMMKSLSEKYFHHSTINNRIKEEKVQEKMVHKEELRQKAEESSDSQSEGEQVELGEGRINESNREILEKSAQSEVRVSYHIDSDQEQLLSSTKPQINANLSNQFQQQVPLKAEKEEESSDSEYQYDRNNILNQPVQFSSSVDNTPVNATSSPGLNIKQIECDIDYQNSFNQEDLQDLAKQGEKIRQESMKLPFDLSIEDKQDIYQFIFLDLCVELTDEYPLESPVIKRIFKFIKNIRDQSKKQKGFKTNTNVIKQYLFEFISFLKAKGDYLKEVYDNIDKPLGPTALDILKYMHASDDDLGDEENNETVFILDIKLFEQFEQDYLNKISFQTYYDDEEKEKKRRAFLKNAIHIHNKAIFDALNQTLDKERPFGVWGEPFSWKKIAKFYHERDVNLKNSIMLRSAQKTIQYGAYMCGFMIDKEECTLKSNPNISQAYIEQIRDDRLSRMLANDLDESEEKMLFIDDEQTEILVEVSHLVYQSLLQEISREFGRILL